MKKNIFVIGFVLLSALCIEASAQFYQIEIKVDSSRKSPIYKNGNPRGGEIDANARSTGNYKRGFFPNQKVIGVIKNEKGNPFSLKKATPLKEEENEK